MCADLVTTWGVIVEFDATAAATGGTGETAAAWFRAARDAYLERCPRLAAVLEAEVADLVVSAERIEGRIDVPIADPASAAQVGVSVVEVRPSSFEMAIRIRSGPGAGVASGRCTVTIRARASGAIVPVPRTVRDEFIALQMAARDDC